MNRKILLEKYIKVAVRREIKEQEEKQQRAEKSMYLVYRFPGLKKLMEDLMSPAFGNYVSNINIIAPKPTTFKVELINSQDFSIKYLGKGMFNVKIAGKKYNPINLGELERASQSISDLLELNYAPDEGKEPKEKGREELGPDLAAANQPFSAEETIPEETPEETETPEKEETPK